MNKILIHTMDHNKHYDYFRRLANHRLGANNDLYYLIQSIEDNTSKNTVISKLKSRVSVEKRLAKISYKNKELYRYLINRVYSLFFHNYKNLYDKYKLEYLDKYFTDLMGDMNAPHENVFYIDNINNQKQLIEKINPDLIVIVGAPFIRSDIVNIDCKKINLHLGYLPNYRGIKTIEWAILNKDFDKIGYTIHELTSELDCGGIIKQGCIKVNPDNFDLKSIYTSLYEEAFIALTEAMISDNFSVKVPVAEKKFKAYYSYNFNPLSYKKLIRRKVNMAIFVGNPVQYHAPIFQSLAKDRDLDFTVFYGSDIGAKSFYSKEFKSEIEWDIPILDGYKYIFFKNLASRNMKGTFSRINPGMFVSILRNKYDVVLIHGYDTVSSWIVFLAAKLRGAKIIWRGEASVRPATRQNFLKKIIKTRVLPFYFKLCDAIMYSCTGNKQYIKQFMFDDDKLFLMPCAVDNLFFRDRRITNQEDLINIRKNLGIALDDFVILFTARFTSRKRPIDLIEAVKKIKHNDITLLFIGDGMERESMESLCSDNAIKAVFTGFKGQKDLPNYYSIADLYAIVSDYDASPKSLNEALNFELPIIATDSIGTAFDLVDDNENGFIVRSRDVNAISAKIDFFNKNRETSKKMGRNSTPISDEWTIENDVVGLKKAINYALTK